MREFRKKSTIVFIYTFEDSKQFRVQATLEHDEIQIELLNLAV